MIRHDFISKDDGDVFTVFEDGSLPQQRFWNRKRTGIGFVFTSLSFEQVLRWSQEPEPWLEHVEIPSSQEELDRYRQEATKYQESFK